MGLDFSHCEVRWAYSGFSRFRNKLGTEIGIVLDDMEGFGGEKSWKLIKDPIKPFLDHSDCDGHLTPLQCSKVAPRLRELVKNWQDDDYDKVKALELAEGMELAFKCNEKLNFY